MTISNWKLIKYWSSSRPLWKACNSILANLGTRWLQLVWYCKLVGTCHSLSYCIELSVCGCNDRFFTEMWKLTVLQRIKIIHSLLNNKVNKTLMWFEGLWTCTIMFWAKVQGNVVEHRVKGLSQPSVNICFSECLATGRRTNWNALANIIEGGRERKAYRFSCWVEALTAEV